MNTYQEILRETYRLTNNGELDAFKKYLSPNISWTEAKGFPYAGTYVGPDEVVKQVHQRLGTEWENYQAKDVLYAFNGNLVIVYGQYSGTYISTGKSFVADFCHVYTFDSNNKIKKMIQVVDSAIVNKVLQ